MFPSKNNGEFIPPTKQGELEEMDEKPEVVQEEIATDSHGNSGRSAVSQPERSAEPIQRNHLLLVNKYRRILMENAKVSAQNATLAFKNIFNGTNSYFNMSPGKNQPDTNKIDPTDKRFLSKDVSCVSSEKTKRSGHVEVFLDASEEINAGAGPSGNRPRALKQGGKEYLCSVCYEEFEYSHDYDVHYKTHFFVCDIYGLEFSTNKDLESHYLSHSDKKRFVCPVCKKEFSKRGQFYCHLRTHTGERPFKCDVCKKEFARKDHLLRHQRTHTAEKPFVCSVCTKEFALEAYWLKHQRTHTGEKPFACGVCKKEFARKDHLLRHQRTHTGEKPYACDVCNKEFARKDYLNTHYRAHTGHIFECDVYSRSFSAYSNLPKHKRSHKHEKP